MLRGTSAVAGEGGAYAGGVFALCTQGGGACAGGSGYAWRGSHPWIFPLPQRESSSAPSCLRGIKIPHATVQNPDPHIVLLLPATFPQRMMLRIGGMFLALTLPPASLFPSSSSVLQKQHAGRVRSPAQRSPAAHPAWAGGTRIGISQQDSVFQLSELAVGNRADGGRTHFLSLISQQSSRPPAQRASLRRYPNGITSSSPRLGGTSYLG